MMFSPEWISASSAVLALIIVAISVHAALRQLELIRISNQSATFLSLVQLTQSEKVLAALKFVYDGNLERVCDELGDAPTAEELWEKGGAALPALFFYEAVGACVIYKMLDSEIVFGSFNSSGVWSKSARFIRRYREVSSRPEALDKLEALAAMARRHREPEWPRMTD
ncbi:MAG TPA: hypothetical protein VMD07_07290 [Candidatus Acidoferrales bacterium]|nr:hypothetical protein [Candidatus Acidoferrales bacterium]